MLGRDVNSAGSLGPAAVQRYLEEHVAVLDGVRQTLTEPILAAARLWIDALARGRKILFFGNGGSAADAQHLAAELVGTMGTRRRGLPAIALTTDTSALTAIGNDFGYEHVFARQVQALVGPEDVVVGISTSGNSANVLRGLDTARRAGARTVGLTGRDGGAMRRLVDVAIVVPSTDTQHIQEAHITIGHLLCLLTERALLSTGDE